MKERNELAICLFALNSIPSFPRLALFCRELDPVSCLLQNPANWLPSSGRQWYTSGRLEERSHCSSPLCAASCASSKGSQFWQRWQQVALGSCGLWSPSGSIQRLGADADSGSPSEPSRVECPLCPVVLLEAAALQSDLWVIPPYLSVSSALTLRINPLFEASFEA